MSKRASARRPPGLLAELLTGDQDSAAAQDGGQAAAAAPGDGQPAVYGDAAKGSGELIGPLDDAGIYNGISALRR